MGLGARRTSPPHPKPVTTFLPEDGTMGPPALCSPATERWWVFTLHKPPPKEWGHVLLLSEGEYLLRVWV